MEENKEEKATNFKTVQNLGTYKNYNTEKTKASLGFGNGFLMPFISGALGCSIVIGTCFGVPSIRSQLLNNNTENSNSSNISTYESNGYVTQTSLSNYSDTAVYAANKILPSIVGIKVEYNVNSMFSMFGGQTRKFDTFFLKNPI